MDNMRIKKESINVEYIKKSDFIRLMSKRGKIRVPEAKKAYELFLDTFHYDVLLKRRSVIFRGVMMLTNLTNPERMRYNFGEGEVSLAPASDKYDIMLSVDNTNNKKYFKKFE